MGVVPDADDDYVHGCFLHHAYKSHCQRHHTLGLGSFLHFSILLRGASLALRELLWPLGGHDPDMDEAQIHREALAST